SITVHVIAFLGSRLDIAIRILSAAQIHSAEIASHKRIVQIVQSGRWAKRHAGIDTALISSVAVLIARAPAPRVTMIQLVVALRKTAPVQAFPVFPIVE